MDPDVINPSFSVLIVDDEPANIQLLGSILRQCAEMGLSSIQLIESRYSVSKPRGKDQHSWHSDALAAMKQSENPWMLQVKPMISFAEALEKTPRENSWYGAVPSEGLGSSASIEAWSGDAALWIGPEGGFSLQEMQLLREKAVVPLCVSRHILRVETAVLAASSLLLNSFSGVKNQ